MDTVGRAAARAPGAEGACEFAARRECDAEIVTAQLGRLPRDPWRVGARCAFGYPATIVSPATFADGTPFPTCAWLTCPWLAERVSAEESAGACVRWTERVVDDLVLAERMRAADRALRTVREAESATSGTMAAHADALLEDVGVAGQRDPLRVKCLHARVALTLIGIDDPIGKELLTGDRACPDERCARMVPGPVQP